MRRRLYFLLPDVTRAHQAVDELLLARIHDHHIHVIARDDLSLQGLPEATLLQRSDFVHGIELGLGVGGATGILAGAALMAFHPGGIALQGGGVLGLALAGAAIGAWAAGMIGTDVPNSRLRRFQDALESGQVLVLVDVPKGDVERVRGLIRRHHPDADLLGPEPTIPAFP